MAYWPRYLCLLFHYDRKSWKMCAFSHSFWHASLIDFTSVLSPHAENEKKRMKDNGWIGNVMLILNLEIIQNFEKFTFHPNSYKLDQNGLCPPERKKMPFTNMKTVIIFSQERMILFARGMGFYLRFHCFPGSQLFLWSVATSSFVLVDTR